MPRLVNYASRFEFLRRAAFALVLDRGVGALSRRAIAAELGTSISTVRRLLSPDAALTVLAMDEVARRRRLGRWGVPKGEPAEVALELLRRLLPNETHRIAEELVWWRLVLDEPPGERVTDNGRAAHDHAWDEGTLGDQFQIATYGSAVRSEVNTTMEAEGPLDRPRPLASHVEEREAAITAVLDRALQLLDVPGQDRATEAIRVRAMIDGLNLAVCLGRLTPAEAVTALAHHIATVRVAA
jgi:AcrR family transcriptional regulator